jgi:hypothetical protein
VGRELLLLDHPHITAEACSSQSLRGIVAWRSIGGVDPGQDGMIWITGTGVRLELIETPMLESFPAIVDTSGG